MNLKVMGGCSPLAGESILQAWRAQGSRECKIHPSKHLHARTQSPTLSLLAEACMVSPVALPP